MFTATLFINAKTWKKLKCPSTGKRIKKKKKCGTHTMEYYSATKRNKLLIRAPTWVDLKSIMLSRSQWHYVK